jgi:hypothetical protein
MKNKILSIDDEIALMKKWGSYMLKHPKKIKSFMIKAGIWDKDGNLTPQYKRSMK